MGFLRRGRNDQPSVLAGDEIAMTAVGVDDAHDYVERLLQDADEMGASRPTPSYVELLAKVCLTYILGPERVQLVCGPSMLLSYNLFRIGYWCRVAECEAVSVVDGSEELTGALQAAYEEDLWGQDWFQVLTGMALVMADVEEEPEGLGLSMRQLAPMALGQDFRAIFASDVVGYATYSVSQGAPGAGDDLDRSVLVACWASGYWLRVSESSLPAGVAQAMHDDCGDASQN